MKVKLHPEYEVLGNLPTDVKEVNKIIEPFKHCDIPDDIEIYDSKVPGINGEPDVAIRVYRKKNSSKAPLLLGIHGGGFVAGNIDNDNVRDIGFVQNVPCTVISVDYRLAPKHIFPAQLNDCLAALTYAYDNPDEFGIDPEKIAIFGTSAGGAIAAGLCLYLRDHNGPKVSMQILNFPALDYLANTTSATQLFDDVPMVRGNGLSDVWRLYLGGFNGSQPSYYAVPALARDLSGLPATFVVTLEYDPLRTEGMEYARRLMEFSVPTELYSLPRVCHGFDMVPGSLTLWIREGMYNSLRREFNML
ncbi:alpha/beta hydrolase [Clostridium scatologenes]|uniref:Alpha/beta hydrolase fold-3 domain protein n=1 Tax=Clostridium scatologenes TaxID=1548 RepID=A0A0E3JN21_CLOSL|nr:alpha/beta hydrolase [Clostridium scatologenes]AKA68767.1 Alpha/beta hydrolase fold-3 domain protein [Clostridium scatologenes]